MVCDICDAILNTCHSFVANVANVADIANVARCLPNARKSISTHFEPPGESSNPRTNTE
jgi:hypothetical protein